MDTQFAKLYANHFVNFGGGRYTSVTEDGEMMIIAYDAFVPNVTPLYEWKLQKGLPTKLMALSEIGTTATDILNYIQNEYDSSDLAYVLLVGDAAHALHAPRLGDRLEGSEQQLSGVFLVIGTVVRVAHHR